MARQLQPVTNVLTNSEGNETCIRLPREKEADDEEGEPHTSAGEMKFEFRSAGGIIGSLEGSYIGSIKQEVRRHRYQGNPPPATLTARPAQKNLPLNSRKESYLGSKFQEIKGGFDSKFFSKESERQTYEWLETIGEDEGESMMQRAKVFGLFSTGPDEFGG
ncbi:hypothetical protein L218DRAFT_1027539 [Marasmius fiardii PR-910]|nr:hypothetical protein L218DRAFT_1027539 [Marasmius fiardii PR-910]